MTTDLDPYTLRYVARLLSRHAKYHRNTPVFDELRCLAYKLYRLARK